MRYRTAVTDAAQRYGGHRTQLRISRDHRQVIGGQAGCATPAPTPTTTSSSSFNGPGHGRLAVAGLIKVISGHAITLQRRCQEALR
jgi:hypothetical protein